MTLREQILSRSDMTPRPLDVPEWGVTVFVRPLTLAERLALKAVAGDEEKVTLATITQGIVDEAGAPVFTEADAPTLAARDGSVLQRLASEILVPSFPRVGDLEKNSGASPSESLRSGSRSTSDAPSGNSATG